MSAQRRVVVDANLLASAANRHFVGLLAEAGEIAMCGTTATRAEDFIAIQNMMGRRHDFDQLRKQSELAMNKLDAWRAVYRQAGFWVDLPNEKVWPTSPEARELHAMVEAQWRSFRTDPRDEHLAATVAVCGLSGLFTANMAMIEDQDWQRIFDSLGIDPAPALCRRGFLVDWALGLPNTEDEPALISQMMLSAMSPTQDFKAPLTKWIKNISSAFPGHSSSLLEHLAAVPEEELQATYADALNASDVETTREAMRLAMGPTIP